MLLWCFFFFPSMSTLKNRSVNSSSGYPEHLPQVLPFWALAPVQAEQVSVQNTYKKQSDEPYTSFSIMLVTFENYSNERFFNLTASFSSNKELMSVMGQYILLFKLTLPHISYSGYSTDADQQQQVDHYECYCLL